MDKDRLVQIRVTKEKLESIRKWSDRYHVKMGPFCLCIIMEKITQLDLFEKVSKDPKIIRKIVEKVEEQKKVT